MYPSVDNPGYGVFVKNFESALVSRGVYVDRAVICGRARGNLAKLIKYLNFGFRVFFLFLFKKYDCIYVHYVAHSLIPLVPLVRLKRICLVCNAHGEDLLPRSRGERIIFRFVKKTLSRSNLIVVPSEFFASIAKKHFPKNSIFVSPSAGVDLEIFKPRIVSRSPDKQLHIGFVSRIDAGKGWDVLLHAINKLRRIYPDIAVKVSMVGEGAQVDQLQDLISKLGLESMVSYLGGLPQNELPKFYSSLDLFVFPTRLAESLGLVGLEALACGVPAMCSDIGGIRSYMQDGINGFLFAPGDVDELVQKIAHFSQLNMEEVAELKAAALSTAQRYDRAKVTSDLYSKLAEVVAS